MTSENYQPGRADGAALKSSRQRVEVQRHLASGGEVRALSPAEVRCERADLEQQVGGELIALEPDRAAGNPLDPDQA